MKYGELLFLLLAGGLVLFLYLRREQASVTRRLAMVNNPIASPMLAANTMPMLVEAPKPRLLAQRLTVKTAGIPIQFPRGKPTNGEVRLHAPVGNTGIVYIGDSPVLASEGTLRYSIAAGQMLPLHTEELSSMWLDSDNSDDVLDVMAEITEA